MEKLGITSSKEQLKPGITVVIVTYCRPKFLKSILEQINNQTKPPVKIIVVDNDVNRSAKNVADQFNYSHNELQIQYITNEINSLSIGRNLGVSLVETQFTCLLDDDVIIPSNYLEQVFIYINSLSDAIGVQGILNLGDRSKIKNFIAFLTGGFYLSKRTCKVRWSISASYPKFSMSKIPFSCEWISGTNQFYFTHIIKEVIWDENLIKYSDGEDLDHSFRVSSSGQGSLYLLPNLIINHVETAEARVAGYKNVLMREAYSYYLLNKLFPNRKSAHLFYFWSRLSTLMIEIVQIPLYGFQKTKWINFCQHLKALRVVFHLRNELKVSNMSELNCRI